MKSVSLGPLVVALAAISASAAPGSAIFPPEVVEMEEDIYGGWFTSKLKAMGEQPLWRGKLPNSAQTVYRFTFIGNLRTATTIRLWRDDAGKAFITKTQIDRTNRGRRGTSIRSKPKPLGQIDFSEVELLMASANLWEHKIGTWDDQNEITIDCTYLVMERGGRPDYRVSQVQISCFQPKILMPVVNKVVKLAGLKTLEVGYPSFESEPASI